VKILDMGLARFFNDEDDVLTRKFDEKVLGTADYLSPEQAVDSHDVDIRTDIYSLGATFYYMLTGQTPFGEGTVTQKLLWHQSRQPKPLSAFRSDVPAGLTAVIDKMMAKEMSQRYQNPTAVAEALAPFTQNTISPPPETEMPRLSLAATGVSPSEPTMVTGGTSSPPPQKSWPTSPTTPSTTKPPSSHPSGSVKQGNPLPLALNLPESISAPVLAAPEPVLEEVPWETLASDTADQAAHIDTGANSVRRVLKASTAKAKAQERRRLGWIAVTVTTLALAGLAFGFWKSFFRPDGAGHEVHRLQVTKDRSGANTFPFISQALIQAKSGDIIELLDDVHYENLIIDSHRRTAVTIQAAPGKEVVWKSYKKDEKSPLLFLSNAKDFVLKGPGLILDGSLEKGGRLNDLVKIFMNCPGLTLEDLEFRSFRNSAVTIENCQGEEDHPVRLVRLRAVLFDKKQTALFFNAGVGTQPEYNDYIDISADTFPGAIRRKDSTVTGKYITMDGKKMIWPGE
jgi:hypothetical protein